MKEKSWFVLFILMVHMFQPVIALSETLAQKADLEQELPVSEESSFPDSNESVIEDSLEDDHLDISNSTSEESWIKEDAQDKLFTENDRQESAEQEESPPLVDQRSNAQGSWGTVPWVYDEETNTMTLYAGEGGTAFNAPWRGYLATLEQIVVGGRVRLPTDSSSLFSSLSNLRAIQNEHNFDTSQVTNMMSMFSTTSSLKSLDLSTWDTRLVTDMRSFVHHSGIEALNVSGFDTSAVTNFRGMFDGATNLKELTLGEKSIFYKPGDLWSVVNLPDVPITERFTGRWILRESINWETDLIAYNTSYEFISNYDGSYPGTYVWEEREKTRWGTVPWEYDEETKTMILEGGEAGSVADAPWKIHTDVERILLSDTVTLQSSADNLFSDLRRVVEIETNKFDTSNVTTMSSMFARCSNIEEIDVSNWNTSSVTSMSSMFHSASRLKNIDVSNWNTSNVRNMGFLFYFTQINRIDVSNWQTSNVTDMSWMFSNTQIDSLDLTNFDTSNVRTMYRMFAVNSRLTYLNLSSFDTSNVTSVNQMFFESYRINKIDLGPNSLFNSTAALPNIPITQNYTGRWKLQTISEDEEVIAYQNSADFMANYDGSHPGTYIWELVEQKEQLVAQLAPVSDQSESITGYMTEAVDSLKITYQNTAGNTVTIEKDSSRIEWGDYQDTEEKIRYFQIKLAENERLATDTSVTLFLSKPSFNTTGDVLESRRVIKGIDYRGNNITLDRLAINALASDEEVEQLILRESRGVARDLLTGADLSNDIRLIETDVTREIAEDGTYYALLEVGNKAYQFLISIDVTAKLGHLKVTIPTQILFESLYDEEESNRSFESSAYEIRNHSTIPVDIYVNQLVVEEDAGITLLAPEENPLDHVAPDLGLSNLGGISVPLLRLSLKTEDAEVHLTRNMEEQHFIHLPEDARTSMLLSGVFYGPYPQWIPDSQLVQGGYYQESLKPQYRLTLRFVPG
ncbi:BspA family leucine-rich repeat surface protein [Enterococcus sp.]|uniref:BspA family leucine-rich repeat surface protein n=1 Tax=Enterococcus sp. TaxID=35783 RepID=UPI0025C15B90|nr:BspA family leucine-rich repeat surface protein [Enterococcus sp.]